MSENVSATLALCILGIIATVYVLRGILKRWNEAEELRARRTAEHAQEQFEIGQRIKRQLENERIMHEPVKAERQTVTVKGAFAHMADAWK